MKKYISLVISVFMILTLTSAAYASGGILEAEYAKEISEITATEQERAVPCSCGNGFLNPRYGNWSSWYNVSSGPCTHGYLFGHDLLQERSRTVSYICNSCGHGYSEMQSETQIICHGA